MRWTRQLQAGCELVDLSRSSCSPGTRRPTNRVSFHDELRLRPSAHILRCCALRDAQQGGSQPQWIYRGGQPLAQYNKYIFFHPMANWTMVSLLARATLPCIATLG